MLRSVLDMGIHRTAFCLAGVAIALTTAVPAQADTSPVTVTISAGQTLATVSDIGIGAVDLGFDPNMHAPGTADLLRQAGVRLRVLDTGAYSDVYRWQTNSYDYDPITKDVVGPGDPADSFANYLSEVRRSGATALIHVNYGSTATDGPGGTDIGPQEAAAWVRQANLVDHDHIKYWEIGEEVYGNGFYSFVPAWEPDHHADKSPTAYGQNVARFAAAMKAVDPTIKIGVSLSPLQHAGIPDWNDPVLAAAGRSADFVDLHWYPTYSDRSDGTLLSTSRTIAASLATIRGQLAANHVTAQIIDGETNDNGISPDQQSIEPVNALYAADEASTMLENGVSTVDWFDTHTHISPDAKGAADDPDGLGYGDYGMLSSGTCGNNAAGQQVCEPAVNTPFAAYYGLALAGRINAPGARLVTSSVTGSATVISHAAIERDGRLVVLLENQSATDRQPVTLSHTGYPAFPVAVQYHYGPGSTGITRTIGSAEHLTLPPLSITELEF